MKNIILLREWNYHRHAGQVSLWTQRNGQVMDHAISSDYKLNVDVDESADDIDQVGKVDIDEDVELEVFATVIPPHDNFM